MNIHLVGLRQNEFAPTGGHNKRTWRSSSGKLLSFSRSPFTSKLGAPLAWALTSACQMEQREVSVMMINAQPTLI